MALDEMAASSVNGDRPAALPRERGFTYLGLLIAVALMGISLAVASEVWTKVAERQKMAQLEWVMDQYVKAIESYYYANTGSVHYYPEKMEDLLEDKRDLGVVRHLRRLYVNPMTGLNDWSLVPAPAGGIKGVEVALPNKNVKRMFMPSKSG
jgi:type II secretory pathway pseudopilin PulG